MPLHVACQNCQEEMAAWLIGRGVDVNISTVETQMTALHTASMVGYAPIVTLLIGSDADVTAVECEEMTPMHLACSFGHVETAQLLLDASASLDAPTRTGRTPLHCAASKGELVVVEWLHSSGATIDVPTANLRRTALHVRRPPLWDPRRPRRGDAHSQDAAPPLLTTPCAPVINRAAAHPSTCPKDHDDVPTSHRALRHHARARDPLSARGPGLGRANRLQELFDVRYQSGD